MTVFRLGFLFLLVLCLPWRAAAGTFELSLGFSFNRSNYSEDSYSWTRRWGASFGFHFMERSEVEVAYQDVVDRNKINGYEDTTFHDRVYSINWVQSFTGKEFPVQPYVKAGVGQLNRDTSGTYNGVIPAIARIDSVTVVLGTGMRIYLTRRFAIRMEATSYLNGGSIRTWKDNIGGTIGASIHF